MEKLFNLQYESIKDKYIKFICSKISIIKEDLTHVELSIIENSFNLFEEKLDDLKILEDKNKRLIIELANLKASLDDSTNEYEE